MTEAAVDQLEPTVDAGAGGTQCNVASLARPGYRTTTRSPLAAHAQPSLRASCGREQLEPGRKLQPEDRRR